VDGSSIKKDAGRPFAERRRDHPYLASLVENGGVDPREIAVYCDLKFDRKLPAPPTFNLFGVGMRTMTSLLRENYRHIIFNLSLQEGWDDPACCFGYIDKDMGSPIR